jgi:hypothetical protein
MFIQKINAVIGFPFINRRQNLPFITSFIVFYVDDSLNYVAYLIGCYSFQHIIEAQVILFLTQFDSFISPVIG